MRLNRLTFPLFVSVLALVGLAFRGDICATERSDGNFSIVVLPDTQRLTSGSTVSHFVAQTEWIVKNIEKEKIALAVHLGDIVGNPGSRGQWENAKKALSILDGKLPVLLTVGNHDMGSVGKDGKVGIANTRNTDEYNRYFPYTAYEKEKWYGGRFEDSNDNYYVKIEAGGRKFLALTLEFGPTDEMVEWANKIFAANADHYVIFVTHALMNYNGALIGPKSENTPKRYFRDAVEERKKANDGVDLWEKCLKKHKNVFLALSGHITGPADAPERGASRVVMTGEHKNTVHIILSNYQHLKHEAHAIRIMKFDFGKKILAVSSYLPSSGKFYDNEHHRFDLPLDLPSLSK